MNKKYGQFHKSLSAGTRYEFVSGSIAAVRKSGRYSLVGSFN
jgi:hypothetical protein